MGYHKHTYYSDMVNRRTCVYRFFDENDRLLYVGLSMNFDGRLAKHRRKPWWPQVARTEIEWFDGRESAKTAEKIAIHHENPVYNITRPRAVSA